MADGEARGASWLDVVERAGNALPDPSTLFVLGALAVMLCSHVAASAGWTVHKTVTREVREVVRDATGEAVVDPATGEALTRGALDPATGEP
ncbi:MAG: AbgT family transporter, partial [Myxococcota bacterium]|nr:AbgT family transporter [Myxococcota bacterium]